jgi:tetratricopeptide (TPR) repeat protein
VPYQLVTREFNDKIAEILSEDGAYIINLIDTHESAKFLSAFINTLQKTFPNVYVTAELNTNPVSRETFVVVASQKPVDMIALKNRANSKIWLPSEIEMEHFRNSAGNVILTDNYTPVENLLAPVVRQSARELLGQRYLDNAKSLKSEGKLDQSMVAFENAAKFAPSAAILAFNEIAMIKVAQNKPFEAVQAFKKAIDSYDPNSTKERLVGSIYLNLGILLKQMGAEVESRKQFDKAIQEFRLQLSNDSNSALIWSRLGDALGMIDDLNEAGNAFAQAIKLEPSDMATRSSLAHIFEFQGRIDEAIIVTKKSIEFASKTGDTTSVAELNEYLQYLNEKKSQTGPNSIQIP